MVLKRVGALSVGKVSGLLYAAMGLIVGLFFSLFSMLGAAIGFAGDSSEAAVAVLFGVGAVFFFPVIYGILGFLCGLLGAALYNLIAGLVGGIEFELEESPR